MANAVVVVALRAGEPQTLGPVHLEDGAEPAQVAAELMAGAGLVGTPHLLEAVLGSSGDLEVVFGVHNEPVAPWTPRDAFLASSPYASTFTSWLEGVWEDYQLRNMGMTADVFVLHKGEFLLLRRTGASEGLWYIPGGIVEPGEEPASGAVREVAEESGLQLSGVELLRVWSYEVSPGRYAYHATFVGSAPSRDVVISEEHTAHRWVTPAMYLESDVATWLTIDHRVLQSFAPHVAHNVELLQRRLGAD